MPQEKKKAATAGRPRKPREVKPKIEEQATPPAAEPERTDTAPKPAAPSAHDPAPDADETKGADNATGGDNDKNAGADNKSGDPDNTAEGNTNNAAPEETADGWEVARVLKVSKPLMKGDDVKALQKALIAHNYHCGVDGASGVFERNTAYAVRCFQAANRLIVDGKAGRYTVAALGGAWKE